MKCGSQRVFGKDVVRALFDELDLHGLIHRAVLGEAFRLGNQLAIVGEVLRLKLPHFRFDLFQIFRGEGFRPVEIVIEAGLDGRADAELGFGEEFEHGGGAEVRGRVPVDLERVWILRRQDLHRRIGFERPLQIVRAGR